MCPSNTTKQKLDGFLARKAELQRQLNSLKRDQVEWHNLSWELEDIEYDILLCKEELENQSDWDRQNIFEE